MHCCGRRGCGGCAEVAPEVLLSARARVDLLVLHAHSQTAAEAALAESMQRYGFTLADLAHMRGTK